MNRPYRSQLLAVNTDSHFRRRRITLTLIVVVTKLHRDFNHKSSLVSYSYFNRAPIESEFRRSRSSQTPNYVVIDHGWVGDKTRYALLQAAIEMIYSITSIAICDKQTLTVITGTESYICCKKSELRPANYALP